MRMQLKTYKYWRMQLCTGVNFRHYTSEFRQFCSYSYKKHQHTANYRLTCGIEQRPASLRAYSTFRSSYAQESPLCRPQTKHTQFMGNLACACFNWQKNFRLYALTLDFTWKIKVVCPILTARNISVWSSFATHISWKNKQARGNSSGINSDNTGCCT